MPLSTSQKHEREHRRSARASAWTWNPLRFAYRKMRDRVLSERGLQPRSVYHYLANGRTQTDTAQAILLPNLSGYYEAAFVASMEAHGLGERCLLVSENANVKATLAKRFPTVAFVTTDYFTELHGQPVDFVWDVCSDPPDQLAAQSFTSVLCYALLEHVLDPTNALVRMASLLSPGGHLFLMTHTPSFPLHRYPRDYFRFHHDFFEDFPVHVAQRRGLHVELTELYSRAGKVTACYQRAA